MPRTGILRCALRAVGFGLVLLLQCMPVSAAPDPVFEPISGAVHQSDQAEFAQVERVQLHFNRLKRVTDARLWGQDDYWATPSELLRAGGGDCEDIAAAKYFTLRELGVPADRLRLVYARVYDAVRRRIEPHVVLWYRPARNRDWLVLDSLRDPLDGLAQRTDLLSWLTFNESQVARWSAQGEERVLGGVELLSPWNTLLARQRALDSVALVLSMHTL